MGAYGCALVAMERDDGKGSTISTLETLESFKIKKSTARCGLCSNNCLLTITRFADGSKFITNNRCERGAGLGTKKSSLPNLYDYKYKRLFDYTPLPEETAPRGVVGLPRVLGMYENYPFWFTLFTELGYSVKLSPKSSREIYDEGIETMPSESVLPAKGARACNVSFKSGVTFIFYPSLPYEMDTGLKATTTICPVVATYSEVIKNAVPGFARGDYLHESFLPIYDQDRLPNVWSRFRSLGVSG